MAQLLLIWWMHTPQIHPQGMEQISHRQVAQQVAQLYGAAWCVIKRCARQLTDIAGVLLPQQGRCTWPHYTLDSFEELQGCSQNFAHVCTTSGTACYMQIYCSVILALLLTDPTS